MPKNAVLIDITKKIRNQKN